MLDKNDLQAIAELMDDKLEKKLEPIKEQLERVDKRSQRTQLLIENVIEPKIQLIYENQVSIIDMKSDLDGIKEQLRAIQ